jgi:hypothetical protein
VTCFISFFTNTHRFATALGKGTKKGEIKMTDIYKIKSWVLSMAFLLMGLLVANSGFAGDIEQIKETNTKWVQAL